jgi:hypothetical protein
MRTTYLAGLTTAQVVIIGVVLFVLAVVCYGDDKRERKEHHNWIIERQSAGQVTGVPMTRRIIGKREIDVYSNGLMFEKGNVVGVSK